MFTRTEFIAALAAAITLGIIFWLRDRLMNLVSRLSGSVPVAGKWNTKIERGGQLERHEEVVLHQFIRRIWGKQTTVQGPLRTYKLRGRLRGQTLTMLYEQTSGGGFETGVILLTVDTGGLSMDGYEIEYDLQRKTIVPSRYEWARIGAHHLEND